MIDIELLKKICEIPGAPGFEQPIRRFIMDHLSVYFDDIRTDSMGNVIVFKKGQNKKKLMLAAHMDEISFIVNHIDEEGFIRFQPLGGFDPKTLTAQRVIIHSNPEIIGVMASKPIHIMTPEERKKAPELKDYFIDTGLTGKKVKEIVEIGTPITRQRELIEMGECVNSKSLDNRVSVFVLIETLKALAEKDVPFDLYGVFTVQEEVGIRGATVAASGIQPDFGIAIDTTIAYDLPGAQAHETVTKLGKGTAIKVLDGMTIADYRMVKFMKETAQKHHIDFQTEILPAGGTDTAAVQRAGNGGSISGAVSIPTRHLHQVIEMAHKQDIRASIELLQNCILEMGDYNWSFR
jgi:putative aminopeptidase FrvX